MLQRQRDTDAALAGIAEFSAFLESLRVVVQVPVVAPRAPEVGPSVSTGGGGGHSDAWWWGVAVCEEGGNNDAFYGYFGKIDGAWAGLDWPTQVQLANALIARAGGAERLSQGGPWADHSIDCAYRESPGG